MIDYRHAKRERRRGEQWEYRSIPVRKGERVERYLEVIRETHLCATWEETLTVLIEALDPEWAMLGAEA